jgi:hypothetical protein
MSDLWTVPPLMSWVYALQPRSILDVGVGFGKYGLLCRETLELNAGRYSRGEWQVRLEGVEVFEKYRTPVWDYVYDQIHIGEASAVVPRLGQFDLGLLCDVIEHFEKDEGRAILGTMLDHCRAVIVTTPLLFTPQEDAFDNAYERHRSHFTPFDFWSTHRLWRVVGSQLMVLASRSPLPAAAREAATWSVVQGMRNFQRVAIMRARYWMHDHLDERTKRPLRQLLKSFRVIS